MLIIFNIYSKLKKLKIKNTKKYFFLLLKMNIHKFILFKNLLF